MADEWKTNDSARTMVHKFNQVVLELQRVASTALNINKDYVYTVPSGFVLTEEEGGRDGL